MVKNLSTAIRSLLHLLLVFTVLSASAQSKPKALIITGNGNSTSTNEKYPPWSHEFQNEKVVSILQENMDIDVDVYEDLSILDPRKLQSYNLIISNSIFLTPTTDQLDAVHEFVSKGKAFLTLHAGILSFLNWDSYADFTGGLFIGGPSSEPDIFKVYTTNTEFWGYKYDFRDQSEHPVSEVVDDFVTKDELYYFQPNTKDFHVIARAENHPIMWWHPFGKGKVMNLSLGHDEAAKNNRGYQELLTNGVRWLLAMPLLKSEPLNVTTLSNRQLKYDNFAAIKPTHISNISTPISFDVKNDRSQDLFIASSDPNGRLNIELTGKSGEGTFTVLAKNSNSLIGKKEFDLKIAEDGVGNIASYFGNTVEVSSTENSGQVFKANNVIDNDLSTRWSSGKVEKASVTIDLKKSYPISKIILNWDAYASDYNVLYSESGKVWSNLIRIENGDGEQDILNFPTVNARLIKIEAVKKAPQRWGYSLYEIEIYR
jgi:type 1 glutamine amidotransferase